MMNSEPHFTFPPLSLPNDPLESLYALGYRLLQEERQRDALAIFRLMLRCAPTDERAWLGLGQCHEALEERGIALEIYGAGTVAAAPSPRCHIARSRLLRGDDRDDDADDALAQAEALIEQTGDESLHVLVASERRSR